MSHAARMIEKKRLWEFTLIYCLPNNKVAAAARLSIYQWKKNLLRAVAWSRKKKIATAYFSFLYPIQLSCSNYSAFNLQRKKSHKKDY